MYRRRRPLGDPTLNAPPIQPASPPSPVPTGVSPWTPGGGFIPQLFAPVPPPPPVPGALFPELPSTPFSPGYATDPPPADPPPPPPDPGPGNGMTQPNGNGTPAPNGESGWAADLGQALKENATKITIAAGLVLGTGVIIGYFVGRGAKR